MTALTGVPGGTVPERRSVDLLSGALSCYPAANANSVSRLHVQLTVVQARAVFRCLWGCTVCSGWLPTEHWVFVEMPPHGKREREDPEITDPAVYLPGLTGAEIRYSNHI